MMKPFLFSSVLCLCGAIVLPAIGAAQAVAPGTPEAAQASYAGMVPPEAVQAVNAYLLAVNAQNPEAAAACAHFRSPETRAIFIENFKKLLESPNQPVTWGGVRLRAIEPLSQGGFLVKYEVEMQKGAGTVSVARSDEVRLMAGAWKVVPTQLFALSSAGDTANEAPRSPLLNKVSQTSGGLHYTLNASLAHTQTIPAAPQGAPDDHQPLLQTAQALIASIQAPLAEQEPMRDFLFGFKQKGDQLTLLCAMPLYKQKDEALPLFVLDDDTTISYQLEEQGQKDPDFFLFSLAYAWRNPQQPGLLESRLIKGRPVFLPENTIYPLELPPAKTELSKNKASSYVFVLAHLPLTEDCIIQGKSAAPRKLQAEEKPQDAP